MLLFGFFGEIGYISNTTTVLLGFIPFIAYFYLIYEHYAKYTTMGIYLFALFSVSISDKNYFINTILNTRSSICKKF